MRTLLRSATLFALFLLPASIAWADEYSDTIGVFKNAGESGEFFKKAYGYAVFPSIGKGGFVVGAAHGDGRVYVGGKKVAESAMTQLSIGAQLGGTAIGLCPRLLPSGKNIVRILESSSRGSTFLACNSQQSDQSLSPGEKMNG